MQMCLIKCYRNSHVFITCEIGINLLFGGVCLTHVILAPGACGMGVRAAGPATTSADSPASPAPAACSQNADLAAIRVTSELARSEDPFVRCAGCGVGRGRGAPVHARAPQNQLSLEKHICFGRLFCVFWPRQQGAAGRQRQQAAAAGSSQQAAAGSSMQVACSRQQFQPAAVGSCGRQQWAGCGQTLAVRQAASGSSRQALPGRWQRHAAAAGSSSNRQQQVSI